MRFHKYLRVPLGRVGSREDFGMAEMLLLSTSSLQGILWLFFFELTLALQKLVHLVARSS